MKKIAIIFLLIPLLADAETSESMIDNNSSVRFGISGFVDMAQTAKLDKLNPFFGGEFKIMTRFRPKTTKAGFLGMHVTFGAEFGTPAIATPSGKSYVGQDTIIFGRLGLGFYLNEPPGKEIVYGPYAIIGGGYVQERATTERVNESETLRVRV